MGPVADNSAVGVKIINGNVMATNWYYMYEAWFPRQRPKTVNISQTGRFQSSLFQIFIARSSSSKFSLNVDCWASKALLEVNAVISVINHFTWPEFPASSLLFDQYRGLQEKAFWIYVIIII